MSSELPPLAEAGNLCDVSAQVMNRTAYLPYREPTVADIGSFDAKRGSTEMPDPLLTSHRLSRFYLVGAGDFVYAIGKLLALDEPMVVSPAVLGRSTAEYASRCRYISDAADGPDIRLSKLANLCNEGFQDLGIGKPGADPDLVALAKGFKDWRSRQQLPKVSFPNYSALVDALSPSMGKRVYGGLSGIAHASAISLSATFLSAQIEGLESFRTVSFGLSGCLTLLDPFGLYLIRGAIANR
ncbi:hypothetical protein OHB12_05345 [Nocardia sp. NBC_01730]|uniref:hypothetical protein n=1 Tax=Nocardia sp. NBC_01730 TaxID=2975998 RepID=UPI002E0D4EBD|nr:hypothetical protein OHB12_05345 [Nocardia sp. NBC_01730]